MKHNKKRNTAFLYETLIAELTKNSLKNNKELQEAIIKILKEHPHIDAVLPTMGGQTALNVAASTAARVNSLSSISVMIKMFDAKIKLFHAI